jgi:hypothetical protein
MSPFGEAAGQIARAIEARARTRHERIGEEALGRELGAIEIPARRARAADVDLPGNAERLGLATPIEDVELHVRDRLANHARRGARQIGDAHGTIGDVHRRLGDAVHVDEAGPLVSMPLPEGAELADVERLTAEDHVAQAEAAPGVARGLVLADELAKGGGCLVEDRDLLVEEELVERVGRAAHPIRDHHQASAVEQRAPELPDGEVEGVGVEQRPNVLVVEMIPGLRGGEEPRDVLVLDQRALGLARRARGVDHVTEVLRARGATEARRGLVGEGRPRRRRGAPPGPRRGHHALLARRRGRARQSSSPRP